MFRYVTSTLTVCAFAGMMTVFAQEQAPSQPPQEQQQQQQQQPPPQQQNAAPAAATLTGCVQEAKTTDGGTAYVLNKAEGGAAAMYVLMGPPPSELASHVNHKVEVTGEVQEPSAPPAAEDAPPSDKKVLRPPFVQVESVKMIAANCN